ncbi:MAG: chemotaxis-specific protein-glutamate methyltransferase CheB [Treponema sp.]|jgi:two-component system chemotaxis response regulator CheB|nr:chemotaxis-specific protein-glutamate methyltransferase CheB [Treponema sp.]
MINTLVIDDSAMVRDILKDFLEGDGAFRVIGEAADGEEAVEKILSLNPDLVTLDIEMPRLNGLQVIERVMKETVVPIVVISSQDTAKTAYEATLRGALEFYSKDTFTASMTPAKRQDIYDTLKRISGIKIRKPEGSANPVMGKAPEKRGVSAVVIGASTGGPKALSRFFSLLPGSFPVPVAVVQHNSSGFDKGFAQWLDTYTSLEVKLADEGERLSPGRVYIARTDLHLALRGPAAPSFTYFDGEPENNQKPSVDVLFRTAAETLKESVISVVLTGMGCDGAAGTKKIRDLGGITLAQDETSSLIYGMPKAAVETGCVDLVLPLDKIPGELDSLVRGT